MPQLTVLTILVILTVACDHETQETSPNPPEKEQVTVEAVTFTSTDNKYVFSVTLKSPDTGCGQYADWWEILDKNAELLLRRVLGHSHVSEQPFVRSGGPLDISPDRFIYIRGHMNNLGYGSTVMAGSITEGFVQDELDINFGADLVNENPLPGDCPF